MATRMKLGDFCRENKNLTKLEMFDLFKTLTIYKNNTDQNIIQLTSDTSKFSYAKGYSNSWHFFDNTNRNYFYVDNCYIDIPAKNAMEKLEKDLEKIEKTIKGFTSQKNEIIQKISFVRDNGLENFDEDEFKVYQVLQTLKADTTDIERAKIIAALVKGNK